MAGQHVEAGHAHRDAHFHLPGDQRAVPVRSATLLSISTPRFIGPGCMTSASGRVLGQPIGVRP
jgi:hypothetical protein